MSIDAADPRDPHDHPDTDPDPALTRTLTRTHAGTRSCTDAGPRARTQNACGGIRQGFLRSAWVFRMCPRGLCLSARVSAGLGPAWVRAGLVHCAVLIRGQCEAPARGLPPFGCLCGLRAACALS